jgi:hypothetical protein
MSRRFDYRRVKLHHSYTISELSALIGAHKHTICRWIAAGLKTTDAKRPLLIHGADFRAFMKAREPIKMPCQLGEFYCFRCRAPKPPALNMADYHPRTPLRGQLSGICSGCGHMMYRATTPAKLGQIRRELDVVVPKAQQRINDSASTLSNVEFKEACET